LITCIVRFHAWII